MEVNIVPEFQSKDFPNTGNLDFKIGSGAYGDVYKSPKLGDDKNHMQLKFLDQIIIHKHLKTF